MMNALTGHPEGVEEPQITLISVERQTYHLFEGEEFLNQLLLVDGEFPCPVRCIHFTSTLELKVFLGEGKNLSHFWAINPAVIDRLRRNEQLLEVDSQQG